MTAHALLAIIEHNARRFPDKVFIESLDQGTAITYVEFRALANRIAHDLARRGIRANDRVALLSNNSIEHLAIYIGVMRYGATVVTVHTEMNKVYFGDILSAIQPRLVLWENALESDLEAVIGTTPGDWMKLGAWSPDSATGYFATIADLPDTPDVVPVNALTDDASIFYTSGTQSRPKGVMLTYQELLDNIEPVADGLAMTENDRILEFRAFNWVSAQVLSGLAPLARGATLILARKFSQSRYFDWVRTHKVTIGVCNPTGIAMFLNRPVAVHAKDVPYLRFMTSSSAALMPEQWRAFEERYGVPIAQGYGSSETGWIAVSNEKTRRMRSVGRPFAYHQLRVVDEEGNPAPQGETGEVELGGNPDNTYRYLADDGSVKVNACGRCRTGDLGHFDADGYLYLTGRVKDLIIRGGVNIAPAEIDNILLELPSIAEAATVGVPDAIYGEEVVAFVALKDGIHLTADDLIVHCSRKLPPFKMPKEFVFKDALPKTERGKMDRVALAEEWKRTRLS